MMVPFFNPHAFLGLHAYPKQSCKLIRIWRPGAKECFFELFGQIVQAVQFHPSGLFEALVPSHTEPTDYRIYHSNGLLAYDPYAFSPSLGEIDRYLFGRGVHYRLYEAMGARFVTHQGVNGIRFVVWAPEAKAVAVVSDFNKWDGRVNPLRRLGRSGLWELFVPGLTGHQLYKFEITTKKNQLSLRADPFAFAAELRPKTASLTWDLNTFQWSDQEWMKRRTGQLKRPMLIYEVHLGSWQRSEEGKLLNYRELAHRLGAYCKEMGFTHVELLPISEYPLDESWGYQVTGFFAVTSRLGTPTDFQYFVNTLHQYGIGVLLDWVPAHFPRDDWALARFDGSCLFEHLDERQGLHPHWKTAIFNYGRSEVSNFLIASALFWLEKMHIDGLRVDAVASMLYLDYGRENGEWIPNRYGSKENLEAIEFLKHLNSVVHAYCPGTLMIAEESTAFPKVTHSLEEGGLGFDLKWNMGWMNDTLKYFQLPHHARPYYHNQLTFSLTYAFSERFVLALSHDEVVHGKKSLLGKMPGDCWQQFAQLRLLYGYVICHPGKKLLFMGNEWGQGWEWNAGRELDWHQLDLPWHQGLYRCVRALNKLYDAHSELWERDFHWEGFEWVDLSDWRNSILVYLRKSSEGMLLCLHNFSPQFHTSYAIAFPYPIFECFNSDALEFGGSGKVNGPILFHEGKVIIQVAPLATQIFKIAEEAVPHLPPLNVP